MPAEFLSLSESDTENWGFQFSQKMRLNSIIGIKGELGAGKTVMTKGICRGLGYKGCVNSPSYSLINEYPALVKIYHIDLYRLEANADWEEIGLAHYLSEEGICLVEWPERLPNAAHWFDFLIQIEDCGAETRKIKLLKETFKAG